MTAPTFRLIRSPALPGARNMALDEALAADPVPTVRLYAWNPWTLSLGRFQRVEDRDLAPFERVGLDVTRRPTGGGAILHGDEITYSVVLPADDPRIPRETAASYAWLHGAFRETLAGFGIEAMPRSADADPGPDPFFCFSRIAAIDLVSRGRKILGSAQRRTRTAFLQHGSLPLTPNGSAPGATSVSEERDGGPVEREAMEEALVRGFERVLGAGAREGGPTPEESALAEVREREAFGSRAWILSAGRGRATGPIPRLPDLPPAAPLFRAAVEDARLRVLLGTVPADRAGFPHPRLRAVDAATFLREEEGPGASPDPWESTFRRSHFAPDAPAGARRTGGARLRVLLLYGDPPEALAFDAGRFDFADLGDRRTGDPARDAAAFLRELLARAPGAVAGPGARALLEGRGPGFLPGDGPLALRAAAVAAHPPPAKA